MQQVVRTEWVLATIALCLALGTCALQAQDKTAGNAGVTFQNDSDHVITVFARYGADVSSCENKPNQAEIPVPARSSRTVDSGTTEVCFCLEVPDRNACPTGWVVVKAGGKRIFR